MTGGVDGLGDMEMAAELWCAAEASRASGDLTRALKLYRRILAADDGHDIARYLCAVLDARPPDGPMPECLPRPTPFLLIGDFLSTEQHAELLKLTWKLRKQLRISKIYAGSPCSPRSSSNPLGRWR